MKFLHSTEITTILSLFASLCATQGVNDGYPMYNCRGVIFYSDSVTNSAARAHRLKMGEINGYPQKLNSFNADGPPPHRIFPMVRDEDVYSGGIESFYFVIVDRSGQQQGVAYSVADGYMPCQTIVNPEY
ncbi:putative candidate secreted effector protein [Blumeria hordei DH14]|uniref:Putative candidate secreted effector protein n=1 Tax=Blumeria graminis f. sp. hordei (strain DH14) TaxID=546991 RepID=N1JI33_BLUG1|nr:putative candidate secreted effector protein [Blumeria hordei DH14]